MWIQYLILFGRLFLMKENVKCILKLFKINNFFFYILHLFSLVWMFSSRLNFSWHGWIVSVNQLFLLVCCHAHLKTAWTEPMEPQIIRWKPRWRFESTRRLRKIQVWYRNETGSQILHVPTNTRESFIMELQQRRDKSSPSGISGSWFRFHNSDIVFLC